MLAEGPGHRWARRQTYSAGRQAVNNGSHSRNRGNLGDWGPGSTGSDPGQEDDEDGHGHWSRSHEGDEAEKQAAVASQKAEEHKGSKVVDLHLEQMWAQF